MLVFAICIVWKDGGIIFSFTHLFGRLFIAGILPCKACEHDRTCQNKGEGHRSNNHHGPVYNVYPRMLCVFLHKIHCLQKLFSAQFEWQYLTCIPTVHTASKNQMPYATWKTAQTCRDMYYNEDICFKAIHICHEEDFWDFYSERTETENDTNLFKYLSRFRFMWVMVAHSPPTTKSPEKCSMWIVHIQV